MRKSLKVVIGLAVLASGVGVSFGVRAQAPAAAARPPNPSTPFQPKPGADVHTDCIIPKGAGALKSTNVESGQYGTTVWTTYEDSAGNVRVYRLYQPSGNSQALIGMAGALTGRDLNAATANGYGPSGSRCDYAYMIARQ